MTLTELLTGLDLSNDGVLVTPEMLEAGKEVQEAWFRAKGAEDVEGLFAPDLAVQVYRAMATLDPIRNSLQVASSGQVTTIPITEPSAIKL